MWNDFSNRRAFLARAGAGFGAVALAALDARAGGRTDPLAPRPPHRPAKAKVVIWCFLDGGPSHIDLFDPKPALEKLNRKPLPDSFRKPRTAMGTTASNPLLASTRTFRRHGKAGHWVSDLYPAVAGVADELCVVKSCVADGLTHVAGVLQMNTCGVLPGRPSVGSWALYGLGSEADNLPGFVVLADSTNEPPGGSQPWGNGFLPAPFAGTRFAEGPTPVLYAAPPPGVSADRQRGKFDLVQSLNRRYARQNPDAGQPDAQLAAYELAFRMQAAAPEAADLSKETEETKKLYGLDRPETEVNGRNCLLARRRPARW